MEERRVIVAAGPVALEGDLNTAAHSRGLVLFAHGSGSSRLSPRNRLVARRLNEAGLATLLVDLLSPEEEEYDIRTGGRLRFSIFFLADRLIGATDWIEQQRETRHLPLGYFGASTGAAAALVAVARRPGYVHSVVSRGGRPDLAGDELEKVEAPTLLIVGGNDIDVLALNQGALARMHCERELVIIPGATHLFEEPGALEEVARLARDWFLHHLASATTALP
jgi:dienelactone hydrolase